jgi:FkbM family methyltransferase
MNLNHFFYLARVWKSYRLSGTFERYIESLNGCLEVIDSINSDDFWLSWYKSYLEDFLKVTKINLIFPKNNYKIKYKAIDKITKNDKIILKDIVLPAPLNNADKSGFIALLDNVLTYLLEDIDDDALYSMIPLHLEGPYEYKAVKLKKGDIVIDAGANIGDFAALSGRKGCITYAFEPMPYVVDNYLSKTAGWNPNITICSYALSDKCQELNFAVGDTLLNSSGNENSQFKVQAIDLDTFAENNKLSSIDFIKADIEGAERHMLMGAKRVLKNFAPKLAICSYHLPDDPQVLRELILDANPDYVVEERFKKCTRMSRIKTQVKRSASYAGKKININNNADVQR